MARRKRIAFKEMNLEPSDRRQIKKCARCGKDYSMGCRYSKKEFVCQNCTLERR